MGKQREYKVSEVGKLEMQRVSLRIRKERRVGNFESSYVARKKERILVNEGILALN